MTFEYTYNVLKGVTHVMIVACYHPLPLSVCICMMHFDLVSVLFGTSNPTSFNILGKHLFHLLVLYVATHIILLTFAKSSTPSAYL